MGMRLRFINNFEELGSQDLYLAAFSGITWWMV